MEVCNFTPPFIGTWLDWNTSPFFLWIGDTNLQMVEYVFRGVSNYMIYHDISWIKMDQPPSPDFSHLQTRVTFAALERRAAWLGWVQLRNLCVRDTLWYWHVNDCKCTYKYTISYKIYTKNLILMWIQAILWDCISGPKILPKTYQYIRIGDWIQSAWHGTFHCFTHELISIKYLNLWAQGPTSSCTSGVRFHHQLGSIRFIQWASRYEWPSLMILKADPSSVSSSFEYIRFNLHHFSPQDNSNVRNCCIKLASTLPTISCLNGFTVGTEAPALGLQTAVLRRSRSRANAASNEKCWNLQVRNDGDALGRSRLLWGSWKQQVVLLWYYLYATYYRGNIGNMHGTYIIKYT